MDVTLKKRFRKRSARSGVSLFEILVVLAIIGMVAAIVGPRVVGYLGRAKTQTAELQIQNIRAALQIFYIDTGRYPTDAEGLAALMAQPPGLTDWNGPYLDSGSGLRDPWDREYLLRSPGENGPIDVYSFGRDGAIGGSGEDSDIKSW